MKIEHEIQQPTFRNPHQKAIINLVFTYHWLMNMHKDFFKPFGITTQQFNILRILRGQFPNGISGSEIKERMLDKNSDVSRLLDRLIAKKLIVKKQSASDKRAAAALITNKGLELLKAIDRHNTTIDGIPGTLSEKEAIQLSNLFDKLRG
jgi:DNA-binding MarR family transcriptional regulator